MYAIIEDSGTQIKVAQGDVIDIDLRPSPRPKKGEDADKAESKSLTFDRVLMIGNADGTDATVGTPYLSKASVTAEVIGEVAGEKLRSVKYTRRKGYKRTIGHRQRYLRVKIDAINS